MRGVKQTELELLYVAFEKNLHSFQDSDLDRRTFIGNVLQDYFTYLRRHNITVPKSLEEPIAEELFSQIHMMLVKKIYGGLTRAEAAPEVPALTELTELKLRETLKARRKPTRKT